MSSYVYLHHHACKRRQVISILTGSVHRILEQQPNYDIRDLLGASDHLITDLLKENGRYVCVWVQVYVFVFKYNVHLYELRILQCTVPNALNAATIHTYTPYIYTVACDLCHQTGIPRSSWTHTRVFAWTRRVGPTSPVFWRNQGGIPRISSSLCC